MMAHNTKETVTIADPESGSSAEILVSGGFNCFSFTPVIDGQAVEVLWAHPNFAEGTERPSGSGIPLLFPFAGRLPGTSFEYQGKTYPLEEGDGRGNAIHGFVMQRPWRVDAFTESRVVGQFHMSIDDPELIQRWPADFRIMVSYEVAGNTLRSEVLIENPDDKPLPVSFATHAYFRLPLAGEASAADTVVTVPVSEEWELTNLIPTGRKLTDTRARQLAAGMQLKDAQFDNIFSGVRHDAAGQASTTLTAPGGRRLIQTFDRTFRHVVVYTPPHREAICMEPYTTLPNAFNLEATGIDTGLRILGPGEEIKTSLDIRLE